jgi:hypothetical protein
VAHFLSRGQKPACVEASKEMLQMFQESEANHFGRIVKGDKLPALLRNLQIASEGSSAFTNERSARHPLTSSKR